MVCMISDREAGFPWTKFEHLLRLPEIFGPQWEDGLPADPAVAVAPQSLEANQFIWLMMDESLALGFVAIGMRGRNWAEMHVGFRTGVRGILKKVACIYVLDRMLNGIGVHKISAFVPEFNMPARLMARSLGMEFEGKISNCCKRHGRTYDRLAYGVTRDEFLNWLKRRNLYNSSHPPEQPECRADERAERPEPGVRKRREYRLDS